MKDSGRTTSPHNRMARLIGDLEKVLEMLAQFRATGITVEIDAEEYPKRRFARLYDPEGNPMELWPHEGRDAPPAVAA